MENQIKNPLSF
jgi:hypothetical protein